MQKHSEWVAKHLPNGTAITNEHGDGIAFVHHNSSNQQEIDKLILAINAHYSLVSALEALNAIHPETGNEPLLQGLLEDARAALQKARQA